MLIHGNITWNLCKLFGLIGNDLILLKDNARVNYSNTENKYCCILSCSFEYKKLLDDSWITHLLFDCEKLKQKLNGIY